MYVYKKIRPYVIIKRRDMRLDPERSHQLSSSPPRAGPVDMSGVIKESLVFI